jgi:hypothetical protein
MPGLSCGLYSVPDATARGLVFLPPETNPGGRLSERLGFAAEIR